ncbi:MAG TPA: hypothetical protein VEH07_08965 [Alphaproteobacteria bacterium]|nr:hypothetical protein [Alphaproteobacteria bacterium]
MSEGFWLPAYLSLNHGYYARPIYEPGKFENLTDKLLSEDIEPHHLDGAAGVRRLAPAAVLRPRFTCLADSTVRLLTLSVLEENLA